MRGRERRSWSVEPWILAGMVILLAWIGVQSRSLLPSASRPGAANDGASPDRPAVPIPVVPRPPRLVESRGPSPSTEALEGAVDDPPPVTAPAPGLEAESAYPGSASLVDSDIAELRRRDLSIPVQGVLASSLVGSFNQGRNGREHEAIDILAPRGTPALAVEDGRVEKLFRSERGGLTVYLFDESETYCYYYAHLDAYADGLEEGDEVDQGDVVGYVGTTGNAPEDVPHLHFAVFKLGPEKRWWEGLPLDPYLVWR